MRVVWVRCTKPRIATTNRKVAIKLIKPHIAASTENLERFRQEGRLASLITHPRCVFVYHADEDQGQPYIVMEMMPGATLKDIVSQQGPLQIGQAINKILDVIDGLQAAHLLGVIHRDVKPSNCFVLTNGHVKVGDFGLSKVLPTGAVSTGRTPDLEETTALKEEAIARVQVYRLVRLSLPRLSKSRARWSTFVPMSIQSLQRSTFC